jgi:hypothetical protein
MVSQEEARAALRSAYAAIAEQPAAPLTVPPHDLVTIRRGRPPFTIKTKGIFGRRDFGQPVISVTFLT